MTEVERIARLLCEADGWGADLLVLPKYPPLIGPFGRQVMASTEMSPAWMLYADYVQATLDAAHGAEPLVIDDAHTAPAEPVKSANWRTAYNL